MDVERRVIEEAISLQDHLDEVDTVFLSPDVALKILDKRNDGWQDELKEKMSPIEKEWFDLIDGFRTMLDDFVYKHEH